LAIITTETGHQILLDDEDYERLKDYRWCIQTDPHTSYARRYSGKQCILMHREILEAPPKVQVDHIDHNGLNNQRANLRLCTQTQNHANRRLPVGRYKGIRFLHGSWHAQISCNRKCHYLGCYPIAEQAAMVYNHAARRLFGEFARVNEITQPVPIADYAQLVDRWFGGLHISESSQELSDPGCVVA
jgi:hypothetical protein